MEEPTAATGLLGLGRTPRGRGVILLLILVFALAGWSYLWASDSRDYDGGAIVVPIAVSLPSLLLIIYTFVAGSWRIRYFWIIISSLPSILLSIVCITQLVFDQYRDLGPHLSATLFVQVGWLSAILLIWARGKIERGQGPPVDGENREAYKQTNSENNLASNLPALLVGAGAATAVVPFGGGLGTGAAFAGMFGCAYLLFNSRWFAGKRVFHWSLAVGFAVVCAIVNAALMA